MVAGASESEARHWRSAPAQRLTIEASSGGLCPDCTTRPDIRPPSFRRVRTSGTRLPHGRRPYKTTMSRSTLASQRYEIRFRSLFSEGRALAFPCDAHGRVELDALGERARHNYFYARAVVGREYALPTIVSVEETELHGMAQDLCS